MRDPGPGRRVPLTTACLGDAASYRRPVEKRDGWTQLFVETAGWAKGAAVVVVMAAGAPAAGAAVDGAVAEPLSLITLPSESNFPDLPGREHRVVILNNLTPAASGAVFAFAETAYGNGEAFASAAPEWPSVRTLDGPYDFAGVSAVLSPGWRLDQAGWLI